MSPILAVNCQLFLGEGIVWDARSCSFWFVDIHKKKMFQHNLNDGVTTSWNVPQKIGWLIPESGNDNWIAGLQEGFARVVFGDEIIIDWLSRPFQNSSIRMNDAKADCLGNIWAGSLNDDDESQPDGKFFKLKPDGSLTIVDTDYCVTNGPAISPDEKLFLHTDSLKRTIYAFDFNEYDGGSLSNKRVWRIFSEKEGFPDGMNFDVEGNLWVAHWGSGLVSCFSENGDLLHRVKLPVSNVTNLTFGGDELDRLFVTTARAGLSPEQLDKEPLAGAIFEIVDHGTKGVLPKTFGKLQS